MEEQENLWEYYFSAFDRIRQRIDLPFKMGEEGFVIEDFPYLEALREALVNLLMHADYYSPAKPRIRIFDNRIEFNNPGGLPASLEKLMETDISMPRNPILAKSFRAVKLAENAGFGFDKMIDGWKTYKELEPAFDIYIDTTIVTFPLDIVKDALVDSSSFGEGDISVSDKGGIRGGIRGGIKGGIRLALPKRQQEVFNMIIDNNTISIDIVAKILGINRSAAQKHFDALKEKGIIKREEGKSGGYWKILIELT